MIIGYDHQIFSNQRVGGISRYFVNLMLAAKQDHLFDYELLLEYSDNLYLDALSTGKPFKEFLIKFPFKGKKWLIERLNQNHTVRELKKKQFDLFHPTYYNTYFQKKINCPYVITVHDMIHERFAETFKQQHDFTLNYKKKCISGAAHIIAISEYTKNDLLHFYPVDPSRISVVHHGLSEQYDSKTVEGLPAEYLLFVGDRRNYKNFKVILPAIQKLNVDRTVHLICVGKAFTEEEKVLLSSHNLQHITTTISPSDAELNFIYRNALAFIFPSVYEGFGFPVLEAMRAGCPSILANATSLPEIGRDAALYFDPEDSESLYLQIKTLTDDILVRNELIKKGHENFKSFNLQNCAVKTLEVYQKAIGK